MNKEPNVIHYYGHIVRKLLIAAAIIMLLGLPVFNDRLLAPLYISLLAVLLLGLFAGLSNPKNKLVRVIDVVVCIIGLVVFEYYAVKMPNARDLLFWFNQALAIIFFIALYYSVKSLRAQIVNR